MNALPLFETPVFIFEIPGTEALNAELARRLLSERAVNTGVHVSNRGGWHSVPDLSRRQDPVFRELSELLVAHFRHVTNEVARVRGIQPVPSYGLALTAWAMVMEHGHYTVTHDHPDATWSSAYYIDPGDTPDEEQPESGHLTLIDPRRGSAPVLGLELFPTTFSLRPAAGLLVIFPGWLQHYVHPYQGKRPRICVAANATLRLT
jgi:uncharacterized protein (TIGR02466 family)